MASGAVFSTIGTEAAVGGTASAASVRSSSLTSSGLPSVAAWHASENASSAFDPKTLRARGGLSEDGGSFRRLPRHDGLEELTHQAVGKRLLELAAARLQDRQPRRSRASTAGGQQRRLSDPGGPLDDEKRALARDAGVEQRLHDPQFAFAFEQLQQRRRTLVQRRWRPSRRRPPAGDAR